MDENRKRFLEFIGNSDKQGFTDFSESTPYTKEEMIDILLYEIYSTNQVLKKINNNYKGQAIVRNFFVHIDGNTPDIPRYYLNAHITRKEQPIDEQIEEGLGGGELHSLILKTSNELDEMKNKGIISNVLSSLILNVQKLISKYDMNHNNDSNELIVQLFEIMDNGIDNEDYEIKFELKAISYPEDIQSAIDDGEQYYPEEGPNIAGNLSKIYNQKYLNKDLTIE